MNTQQRNKEGTMKTTRYASYFSALLAAACLLGIGVTSTSQAQVAAETAILNAKTAPTSSAKISAAKPIVIPEAKAVAAKPVVANAATATAATNIPTPSCNSDLTSAEFLAVPEGKSTVLNMQKLNFASGAFLRTVGNPEVIQVEPLTSPTPRGMFFVFGKKIGSTNLMFQDASGRCALVEVGVGIDTASVEEKIRQLMPEEKGLRVQSAADSLVLSGTVSDIIAVEKAIALATAFTRRSSGVGAAGGQGAAAAGGGAAGGQNSRVVNMLSVAAPQQVMLEVKVAEISKTMLDKLGVSLAARRSDGSWTSSLISNFLSGSGGVIDVFKKATGEFITLDAEKKDGLVKILAEPTVMAISGQEGSFLAGGKIFIPVSSTTDNGFVKISLEEKEFGVGLKFTPTVLEGGRINLKVAPEVSELNREGVGISAAGFTGQAILPSINTRRASTTVQLYDGQSFAIGGLIKNNVTQNIKALPVLGELPIIGALFRSSDFQTDRTELVFIVTPRLVKPLPADYALPTDSFVEPTRSEFFLKGKMEGSAAAKAMPAQPNATPKPATGFDIK
jgi:pilus assembly protein CpaC